MNDFEVDLNAYLTRIGFDGPHSADLKTLKRIVFLHQNSIAFENLNSFAGLPVVTDPATVQKKLLHDGRGGYCYEQNGHLRLVLIALGFPVRLRMARIRWMQQPEVTTQRGHMLLNVAIDGTWYLCDVAFGAMTPTAPLRLDTQDEQCTPHQPYRLTTDGNVRNLEVKLGENWRPVYSFDDMDHFPVDFEAVNWQVSTHPHSEFVNNLIVARTTEDRRQILTNTNLAVRHSNGRVEKSALNSEADLRSLLTQMFGIKLPTSAAVDKALGRLFFTR